MGRFARRLFRALGDVRKTADADTDLIFTLAVAIPPMSLASVKAAVDAAGHAAEAERPAASSQRERSLDLPTARNACPRFV